MILHFLSFQGSLEHGGSIEVRGKGNLPPIVIKLPSFEEAKAKAEAKLAQLIAGGKDPLEIDPMTYDPPAPLKKVKNGSFEFFKKIEFHENVVLFTRQLVQLL